MSDQEFIQRRVPVHTSDLLHHIDRIVGIYRSDLTEEQRQDLGIEVAQDAMDQILRGLEA